MHTFPFVCGVLTIVPTWLLAASALCQQPKPTTAETEATPADDPDHRLALMRKTAGEVKVQVESSHDRSTPARLQNQPVLRFNDPTRSHQDGTLWLYGEQGRPSAVLEVWSNDARQPRWFHSILSTSTVRVTGSWEGRLQWQPQVAGVVFRGLPNASPPASRRLIRQRQLKALARHFDAYEVFRGEHAELRLLAKPLHLYADPTQKVLDGGLFLFTHGTNPELLLLLEATEVEDQRQWRYALTPSGSAEFHVSYEDEKVRTLPAAANVTGQATDAYWLFPRELILDR